MRLNLFSRDATPEPEPAAPQHAPTATAPVGKTFPADEVIWGIAIRNGFDELDDPWYHHGTTQHAYLEGNDNVAICGFRPPQSGPRTRRRARLGLPTTGDHPMCGMCARMVVAPRPRVPVAVRPGRPTVAVPVSRPAPVPNPAPPVMPAPVPVAAPAQPAPMRGAPQGGSTSPWVNQRVAPAAPAPAGFVAVDLGGGHDHGLMERGIHTDRQD